MITPLPHYITTVAIPDEIYTCFKKYYLTNEKLSAQEAIYRAQKELQSEQKIEQPYAYTSTPFVRKVRTEFTKEQIEYFRNNIEAQKPKFEPIKVKEPLDMKFEKAAYIYLKHLKMENKLERLMHDKTNYKNHLKPYFDNLSIREITTKVVAQFKQSMFDNGFQLVSVNIYITLLKLIIKTVCPLTNSLVVRNNSKQKVYSVDMNILSDEEITELLNICKKKYPAAYPVIYLSLSTGASVPEILALTWERINFEDNTIFLKYFLYEQRLVMNRCGSTIRKLKFDDDISGILKKKFEGTKPEFTDFVFKFDSPKSPQQYIENVVLRGLSAHLGIVRLHPSDLQHNFVNMCLKQKVPITFIQKALGYYAIERSETLSNPLTLLTAINNIAKMDVKNEDLTPIRKERAKAATQLYSIAILLDKIEENKNKPEFQHILSQIELLSGSVKESIKHIYGDDIFEKIKYFGSLSEHPTDEDKRAALDFIIEVDSKAESLELPQDFESRLIALLDEQSDYEGRVEENTIITEKPLKIKLNYPDHDHNPADFSHDHEHHHDHIHDHNHAYSHEYMHDCGIAHTH